MDKYIPVIESFNLPYEIIVVIDGQDGTENVIKNYKNLTYYKSIEKRFLIYPSTLFKVSGCYYAIVSLNLLQ